MSRTQLIIRILIIGLIVVAGWKLFGKAIGIAILLIAIFIIWFALSFSWGGRSGWQTLFGTGGTGPEKAGN